MTELALTESFNEIREKLTSRLAGMHTALNMSQNGRDSLRGNQARLHTLIATQDDNIADFNNNFKPQMNAKPFSTNDATNAQRRTEIISLTDDLINNLNLVRNMLSELIAQEGGIFRKWYPNYKMRAQSRRGKRGSRRGKRGSRRGKRGSRRR
jgi:hypothetical protein